MGSCKFPFLCAMGKSSHAVFKAGHGTSCGRAGQDMHEGEGGGGKAGATVCVATCSGFMVMIRVMYHGGNWDCVLQGEQPHSGS